MYPGPDPNALPRPPEHQRGWVAAYPPTYTENGWVGLPPPAPAAYYPAGPVFINAPRPFNHLPHLMADAISCGLWLPVHLLLWALHRG